MMLATDDVTEVVNTSFFNRQRHQYHHCDNNHINQAMQSFPTNSDDISDCDAKSDKSISNNNNNNNAINLISKSTQNIGRSNRRKQLAPRSRLVRQCDLCDFSSTIINEFKNHMKFEHGQEQVYLCDTCRYYSLSSYDFNLHLNSHHDSSKNNQQSLSQPKLNLSIQQSSNVESTDEIEDDNDEHQLNIEDSKEQNKTIFEHDEQSSDDEQVSKKRIEFNICLKLFAVIIRSKEGARSRKFYVVDNSSEVLGTKKTFYWKNRRDWLVIHK
ncbi:unnamed protein product [Rotaria sp. Silwood1]|nr:unnamed protein product [Rotaria sp. Silwood1]